MTTVDRFPQYIATSLTMTGANDFTTDRIQLPVNRLRVSGGRAQMVELLWVETTFITHDFAAANDEITFSLSIGPTPTTVVRLFNPDSVMYRDQHFDVVTSGGGFLENTKRTELQSLDGFGFLVASDELHAAADTVGMAAAVTIDIRIYYRHVTVPIEEFIGLVQSQQS